MNVALTDPQAAELPLEPDEVITPTLEPRPAPGWLLPASALLLVAGLGLRLWHLAANRSLWGDEAAIASNIRDMGFGELMGPLLYDQAAPILWLWLERLAFLTTRSFEWGLRVVPFLGGALGLMATAGLALRLLPAGSALFAILSLSLLPTHIYYAGEIKQYASDLGLAALLLLIAVNAMRSERLGRGHLIGLLAAGLAAIPLSQPIVFTLAAVGGTLFLNAVLHRRWRDAGLIVLISLAWALLFGLLYVAIYSRQGDILTAMRGYWEDRFAPVPPHSVEEAFWYYKAFVGIPTAALYYGRIFSPVMVTAKLLAGFLFLLGIWRQGRSDWRVLLLFLVPLLLAFVASAVKFYPFSGRFLMFAVPGIIILIGAGLASLAEASLPRFTAPLAALLLLALPLSLTATEFIHGGKHRPFNSPDIKAAYATLAQERQPGDALYLYASMLNTDRLYRPPFGLGDMPVQGGRSLRSGVGYLLADLEKIKVWPRVWVLQATDDDSWGNSYVDELSLFRWGAARLGAREAEVHRFANTTLILLAFPPADPNAPVVFPEPDASYRPDHPASVILPGENLPLLPGQPAPAPQGPPAEPAPQPEPGVAG